MQRRTLIKRLGGLLLAPALPAVLPAGAATLGAAHADAAKKPVLRVAHLTDVHLKDKWDAPARFRRCLRHVQAQRPGVDVILNGGDIVFDMNKENLDIIKGQWQLWHSTLKAETSVPIFYALGNHDVWWNEDDKGQALYGKKFSMNELGLSTSYYSFVRSGWKFVILDSVHLDVDNSWYIGRLGDEQMGWLANELKTTDAAVPVCVLTHIPILTATNLIEDNIVNKWVMTGGEMHTDTSKIIDLFFEHPNVKLCLSGHIHLREKLVYNRVTYLCNGAVSGAWWEGNRRQTAPGYGLIDLYADGTFDESYVNY